MSGKDASSHHDNRAGDYTSGGQDSVKSPTEILSTGSMSPVLGAGLARKNRQNFGSPGKAKTTARLEQLRYDI